MKREILFRGKHIKTNQWVYGYLVISKTAFKDKQACIIEEFNHFSTSTTKNGNLCFSETDSRVHEVDIETVGQLVFTKEKVRFFEGDIVMYDLEAGCGEPKRIDNQEVLGFGYTGWQTNFRLLGNKFDNPELIKNYRNEF